MHIRRSHILLWFLLIGILPLLNPTLMARDFVVILDAGHGGHDAGAIGRISKEKNINLKVTLAVGQLLEKNNKDIKVVYTRKTDTFIALHKRAEIANNAKGDLFISIHTNSLPKGKIARGTETYTLGLHKTKENLAVAQKENSVILIESDYKQRYADFNPNSAESYIMFEFIQDKNMEQSVALASNIQDQFRLTAKRNDHGVRQAGFLVLHATSMPSVLVELGYISTPDEEQYLNSQAGINALSKSIYNAILAYKNNNASVSGNTKTMQPRPETKSVTHQQTKTREKTTPSNNHSNKPIFKVQIMSTSIKLNPDDHRLKGLKPVEIIQEGKLYKYFYGSSTDYNQIYNLRKQILPKFKDAFITAYRNGKKMDVNQAIEEFKQQRNQ